MRNTPIFFGFALGLTTLFPGCGGPPVTAPTPPPVLMSEVPALPNPCVANPCAARELTPGANPCAEPVTPDPSAAPSPPPADPPTADAPPASTP